MIDVLINNGLVKPQASLLAMDEWDWQRTIDFDLGAPFLAMQSVGRIMQEQGGGVMINTIGDDQPADERCGYQAHRPGTGRALSRLDVRESQTHLCVAAKTSPIRPTW